MLGKYLEFKTFEFFRDKWTPLVKKYAPKDSKAPLYSHLFMAPDQGKSKRSFQIRGAAMPLVCFWVTSPLRFHPDFYSRSVLERTIKDKEGKPVRCFYYDVQLDLSLYSSSYFKDFRDKVAQDIVDLDRLRYFLYDISELIPGMTTKVELLLKNCSVRDNDNPRSFDLTADYTLSATVPYSFDFGGFIDRVRIYLNEHKIYEYEVENGKTLAAGE